MIPFTEWFAPSLLKASLSLAVTAWLVAACVQCLRLRSPTAEQWAWFLVLVQGVMLVYFTVPVARDWLPARQQLAAPADASASATSRSASPVAVPARELPVAQRPLEPEVTTEPSAMFAEVSVPVSVGPPRVRHHLLSWKGLFCAFWFAGLLALALTSLLRYVGFTRRMQHARPACAEWTAEWEQLCRDHHVAKPIPLVVARDIGPALCRLPAGYRLVVPESTWQTLTSAERCAVYRHELEHYRRSDLWWSLGARVFASVHWFNPCAWWAARQFEAQCEFACDRAAAGDNPIQFSELLMQLVSGRSTRIVGVQSVAAGSVYERVQRLLAPTPPIETWRAFMPIGAALLAICVAGVRLEAASDSAEVIADSTAQDLGDADPNGDQGPVAADGNSEADDNPAEPSAGGPTDVGADEIAGAVVDADGKPVADALVDVWHWYSGNETRTDDKGKFRLSGINSKGRAEVRITKEGYSPAYFPQQPVGAKGWRITLTNTTYLEGVVTGADGKPASGAEIRAAFGPIQGDGVMISEVLTLGHTKPDGTYRLYLKPDTYDIQVAAPGQGVKRLSRVVVTQDEATSLSITLERGVRFEARVVDSQSGKPVEDFILWQWRPPHLVGRSDADGRIVFEDLVPGRIELSCGGGEPLERQGMKFYQHGPFGRWWSEQAVNEWERKYVDDRDTGWQRNFDSLSFDLTVDMDAVEIVVEQGVTVRGRVTDPEGNPVAEATVAPAKTGSGNSITGDTRYSVKTEEDGTYTVVLPASNAAQYNLVVHDGDYQEWRHWANGVREPMRTTPGQVIENYDLQLTKPGVVRGRVTLDGKPVANREVRTHAFDKWENRYYDPTTRTDKNGNFELRYVRPGKHYLQVEPFWLSAESAPSGSKIIEVQSGQVLDSQDLFAAP